MGLGGPADPVFPVLGSWPESDSRQHFAEALTHAEVKVYF